LGKEFFVMVCLFIRWGLTNDKIKMDRRGRGLSIYELFAGAYILYTKYYNPYIDKESDILDVIEYIANG